MYILRNFEHILKHKVFLKMEKYTTMHSKVISTRVMLRTSLGSKIFKKFADTTKQFKFTNDSLFYQNQPSGRSRVVVYKKLNII